MHLRRLARSSWGMDYRSLRTLYRSTYESMVTYAAPVWYEHLDKKCYRNILRSSQRTVLLVVTKAHRTSPGISLPVITGVLPIDLLVQQRAKTFLDRKEIIPYEGGVPQLRRDIVMRWQQEWDEAVTGRQTHSVWPNIENRLKCRWVRTDFYLTQFWTGHGNYRAKLASFELVGDTMCDECGAEDTPTHAVFECPTVQEDVLRLRAALHRLRVDFDPQSMVGKKQSFELFARHVQQVMGARAILHPYYN